MHMDLLQTALALRRVAQPIVREGDGDDEILARIGHAQIVLIGEASHGTHDFYAERARLTRLLIEKRGFDAVAAEADWPDAWRVNRWVHRLGGDDATAAEALRGFERFPAWMWRNAAVLEFTGWLRDWNEHHPAAQAGFYGLDLYAFQRAIDVVLSHLDRTDPAAAQRARARYACFDVHDRDPHRYGYTVETGFREPCEDEVVAQLVELEERAARENDGHEDAFHAEQSARLVAGAEQYYRAMFRGPAASWNVRDMHMQATLEALVDHLRDRGGAGRVVVWAHNSHLGDARTTEMGRRGEHNVGQLVRERYGRDVVNVGFSTHHGSVRAAHDWDEPAQRRRVRRGLPGSYEALFHDVGIKNFLLLLRDGGDVIAALREPKLERAIGVIYRPETERLSHYFFARLPDQFNALIHLDETRALEPLERNVTWERGEEEVPETYPFAV